MTSVSSQLVIYEEMYALSEQMVAAAQANEWDKLIALESRVSILRDKLMTEESVGVESLSGADRARKAAMIRKILEDNAEILCHTEPWMENVRQFLGSQHQRRKMHHAYAVMDALSNGGSATEASFG
ncbi:MAG: flagellar protein FliT [Rugosibacter sp.]|nr:MAG: flagellar protein FliT [Rugosibacter sp.]TBR09600.1 MAG: flagellar protein FliT [Rugosibacter sp.]